MREHDGKLYDPHNRLEYTWNEKRFLIHAENQKYAAMFSNCSNCFGCGPTDFQCSCGGTYKVHYCLVEQRNPPDIMYEHPIRLAEKKNAPSRLPKTVHELKTIMERQPNLTRNSAGQWEENRIDEICLPFPIIYYIGNQYRYTHYLELISDLIGPTRIWLISERCEYLTSDRLTPIAGRLRSGSKQFQTQFP
jgi:hypothetical protein